MSQGSISHSAEQASFSEAELPLLAPPLLGRGTVGKAWASARKGRITQLVTLFPV